MRITPFFLFVMLLFGCRQTNPTASEVITADIDLFWQAYDRIVQTDDSTKQVSILEKEYFAKGSPGLAAIREARNYTAEQYIAAIRNYPAFWSSVRNNTLKVKDIADDLQTGIDRLQGLYPELKPAKIYFTIGALRTNGTTMDSLVLIGSELALADEHTETAEFPDQLQGLRTFFDSNPINDVVLLNVHEYVHTQQNPMVQELLHLAVYEGVAEFVSSTAMARAPSTPAIAFGQQNDSVRLAFEQDMFYGNNVHEWLYSNAENDFGIRDLGYYIGYAICEKYYKTASDKQQAIKDLIELDLHDRESFRAFVDGTGFFSKPIDSLEQDFEARRPEVISMSPFTNKSKRVTPDHNRISITFSQPMDPGYRNFDFGPIGKEGVVRFKREIGYSADGRTYTFEIEDLAPNKHYQLLIGSGFRNRAGVPLKPYLIDFRTSE